MIVRSLMSMFSHLPFLIMDWKLQPFHLYTSLSSTSPGKPATGRAWTERLSLLLSETNLYSRTWRITMREPAPSSSSYMRPRWPSSSRSSFQSIRSGHSIVLYHRGFTLNAELLDAGLGVWRGCTGEHSPRVTGPTGYASSAIAFVLSDSRTGVLGSRHQPPFERTEEAVDYLQRPPWPTVG